MCKKLLISRLNVCTFHQTADLFVRLTVIFIVWSPRLLSSLYLKEQYVSLGVTVTSSA